MKTIIYTLMDSIEVPDEMSDIEIEETLKELLGEKKVIWIERSALLGDDEI